MQLDNPAIAGLVGVVIGGILAGLFQWVQSSREREQVRRLERIKYWQELGRTLVEARAELQYLQILQQHDEELRLKQQAAYGRAFGVMLLCPDKLVRDRANDVMELPEGDPKLQAINQAIQRIGDLISSEIGMRIRKP
ncbi:MAG: hypothetical protein JNM70_19945 [Anaerolineae bacterium]|nr:hypothetical protein [Anaerolineae bacterium]